MLRDEVLIGKGDIKVAAQAERSVTKNLITYMSIHTDPIRMRFAT